MKILVKYPTRSRPTLFLSTLAKYMREATWQHTYLVTIDSDDRTMNNPAMLTTLAQYPGVEVQVIKPAGKVHAINSGVAEAAWDYLVLASDDHIPVAKQWDTWMLQDFRDTAPNGEPRMLWYTDIRKPGICFMPVMNRAAFDITGYIYHPDYTSLWCDNEQTEVMVAAGIMLQVDRELWRNESPDWGGNIKQDRLYRINNSLFRKDQQTYLRRKRAGFPHDRLQPTR
jgi:hypothetical protein